MPRDIDYHELIRQHLRSTAERMVKLADELDEAGEPFTESDKKLIRMAILPAIDEMYAECVHFHLIGERKAFSESFQALDRLFGMTA